MERKDGREEGDVGLFPRHRCRLHPRRSAETAARWLQIGFRSGYVGILFVVDRSLVFFHRGRSFFRAIHRTDPFPVEFFHHSIIPVAREGGDSPLNRPMKRYRGISLGGAQPRLAMALRVLR